MKKPSNLRHIVAILTTISVSLFVYYAVISLTDLTLNLLLIAWGTYIVEKLLRSFIGKVIYSKEEKEYIRDYIERHRNE